MNTACAAKNAIYPKLLTFVTFFDKINASEQKGDAYEKE